MAELKRGVIDLEMARKILLEKEFLEVSIVSSSMSPLIEKGETVGVYSITEELNKYDIIVFLREEKFVAHYVWKINGQSKKSYITRSLENPGSDELPVRENEILGIVKNIKFSLLRKILMRLRYG